LLISVTALTWGAENVIIKTARIAAAHPFEPLLVLRSAWSVVRGEIPRQAKEAGIAVALAGQDSSFFGS
jgi:hypothetical protein